MSTPSPRGSNAANQDPEYLKRKFRQAWNLSKRLSSYYTFCQYQRAATTGPISEMWHNRVVRTAKRASVVDRTIERLTAPAGGAE